MNVWKIDMNNNITDIYELLSTTRNCTYLLNITDSSMNLLEKMVFDIAMFHFSRLSIVFEPTQHFIEFWWKSRADLSRLHTDCDEYDDRILKQKNYSLVSCITYLNDIDLPTVITDIDENIYATKKYYESRKMIFSFPRMLKHISFPGKYYHGVADIFNLCDNDRYIIAINLWNKRPETVPFYDNKVFLNSMLIKHGIYKTNLLQFTEDKTCVKRVFDHLYFSNTEFDDILYNSNNYPFTKLNKYFRPVCREHSQSRSFESQGDSLNEEKCKDINLDVGYVEIHFNSDIFNYLYNKYGDIIMEIKEVVFGNISINNRFFNNNVQDNFYSLQMCKYLKNEFYKLNVNSIPLKENNTLLYFVLYTFSLINNEIKEIYNIDKSIQLKYDNVIIEAYDNNFINYKKSILNINILLSDESIELISSDNNIIQLKTGSLYISNGKQQYKHVGNKAIIMTGYMNMNIDDIEIIYL